ncbi:MAG: helix-turn-helix transcriptional regulator [Gammaproteobacteria bacterium]|nr:helix-turn-helix transcriptional regulator [Gammaproteobacteria bacterium]
MDIAQLQGRARHATELLKVMSNEWRLLILCHLAIEERSVGALESELGLGQSALSQHLAVLRREKLVATRRDAQSIYYSLDSDDAKAIMSTLYERFCSLPDSDK